MMRYHTAALFPPTLVGLATFFFLVCLFGCQTNSETVERVDPSVLKLRLAEGTDELSRPPATFNHALHVAIKPKVECTRCHSMDSISDLHFRFKLSNDATVPERMEPIPIDDPAAPEQRMDRYHDLCMGCHKETLNDATKETGPFTCSGCHKWEERYENSRVPIYFDYSLHARHSKAESDKCESCHHIYNEKMKKLQYKKGTESACFNCHGDKDTEKTLSLRRASHKSCVNCHIKRTQKGQKTGPIACVGCHDKEEQNKIERLTNAQPIAGKQPRLTWIHRSDKSKVASVLFNHQKHEPLVDSCSSCHHKTLKPCDGCHNLETNPTGGGVGPMTAFHLTSSEHSCVGCHTRETYKKGCVGCHDSLDRRSAETTCSICHNGPIKGDKKGGPKGEVAAIHPQAEEEPGKTAVSSETLDSGMSHSGQFEERERDATSMIFPLPKQTAIHLDPLPEYSDDFPESITINGLAKEYRPSLFPHGKIVKSLDSMIRKSELAKHFHGKTSIQCSGCHHQTPIGSRPVACKSCHKEKPDPILDKPDLKTAYHRQCLGCHQKMKLKQQGCSDCHEKASREVN